MTDTDYRYRALNQQDMTDLRVQRIRDLERRHYSLHLEGEELGYYSAEIAAERATLVQRIAVHAAALGIDGTEAHQHDEPAAADGEPGHAASASPSAAREAAEARSALLHDALGAPLGHEVHEDETAAHEPGRYDDEAASTSGPLGLVRYDEPDPADADPAADPTPTRPTPHLYRRGGGAFDRVGSYYSGEGDPTAEDHPGADETEPDETANGQHARED